jgi:uncharacterized protein (DUF1697 family)
MPALRELLDGAGFDDVRTYLQSGNVVLSTSASPAELAATCERLIAERFGFEVPVITRTRTEVSTVVKRDPLGEVAEDPKRYVVHFLTGTPDAAAVKKVAGLAAGDERVKRIGREFYSWHPDGIARSKLAAELARQRCFGAVTVTARNWATVTQLLAIASE